MCSVIVKNNYATSFHKLITEGRWVGENNIYGSINRLLPLTSDFTRPAHAHFSPCQHLNRSIICQLKREASPRNKLQHALALNYSFNDSCISLLDDIESGVVCSYLSSLRLLCDSTL